MTDEIHESPQAGTIAPSPVAAVHCAPLPAWVVHQPYSETVAGANDPYIDHGLLRILNDSQVNLGTEGYSQNFRTVQRIVTRAGAEKAAHVAVEFDPATQRVDVHFIRVVRADAQIDHTRPDAFQILRREKKLEQLALDGRLTASLLVPDLRIDDVLDISLTITTLNPIFGGRYGGWLTFNGLAPWIESRHRLRRPPRRAVAQKTFGEPPEGSVDSNDEVTDSRWSLRQQARLENEEFTPPWQFQVPTIQLAEFDGWGQVAQLFVPYYAAEALPAELAMDVDRLAQAFPDPADRAVEWLRFVQTQLRYFAMSLGEGGLIPRDLNTIWSRRYGDCKDGSRLFVAGAQRLGLDACAALTSTTHGQVLDELLASPTVFNHCLVRLRSGGRTYWLDPTMPRQEGRLAVVYQPHCGWALPLTAETTALERMGTEEPISYRHTEQTLELGSKVDSPIALTLRVRYCSFAADALRHKFENEGNTKFSEQVLSELRNTWPAIVETSPLSLEDDTAANSLTATFRYEIRDAWKAVDAKGRLGLKVSAGAIAMELNPLKKLQRRTDLYLGRPRKATSQARLLMPKRWSGKGWNKVLNATGIQYINNLYIDEREIRIDKEITISNWFLPASQAGTYQELVAKVRENAVTIFGRATFGRVGPPAGVFAFLGRRPLARLWLVFWVLYILWYLIHTAARNH